MSGIAVHEGLFIVEIDFGTGVFGSNARWLEIAVRSPSGSGSFVVLSPRQQILAAPVAQFALNVDGSTVTNLNASNISSGTLPNAALSGAYGGAVSFTNPSNSFSGGGSGLTNLNASNLATGTLGSGRLAGAYSNAVTFSNASNVFTGNGAGLTNLNAGNISSGTLGLARGGTGATSASAALSNLGGASLNAPNSFMQGPQTLVAGAPGTISLIVSNLTVSPTANLQEWRSGITGTTVASINAAGTFSGSFSGSGTTLTSLNAANISSGNLTPARLPTGGNWTLTSTLNVDSNTLVVDPLTNRIGIGTSTLTLPVQIRGAGNATVDIVNPGTAGAGDGVHVESQSPDGYALLAFNTSTGGSGGRAVVGQVTDPNGYAGHFTGGRNYFGGNVGIGATQPASAIHVLKASNPPSGLPSSDNGLLLGTTGTTTYKWIQTYGGDLSLNPQGNDVGIGMSNPTARLHVDGGGATNTALAVQNGAIRVSGAGVGTSTPMFSIVANSSNSQAASGALIITLDHPLLNADPNALVQVTANGKMVGNTIHHFSQLVTLIFHPGASRWLIIQANIGDDVPLADFLGHKYTVLVVKP